MSGRLILEAEKGPRTSLPTFSHDQDEDPDTPNYVRFRVKETVCDKATYQTPEQCNFREHGVRQRAGVVGGGRLREYFHPVG